ncbi:MAG: methyltransferase [Desulfomonile tiedjei]|nr:methyltransferase [Desulfomonile tiedjei]
MHDQTVKHASETIDGLFRNKVRVIQAARGYRVSEDALIVAWFARPREGELVLDAGTGCGVIAFGLVAKEPSVTVVGLEIQEALADRAGRGIRLNRLESGVCIVRGDVRHADLFFRPGRFDVVVSNPPYHEPGRGRISLEEEKALCRHQLMMPLCDLLRISRALLKPQGRLAFIYPAGRADSIREALKETGFEPARMLWIQPYAGAEPCLLCMEARPACDGPALVQHSLVLYDEPGKRTSLAAAILAGEEVSFAG